MEERIKAVFRSVFELADEEIGEDTGPAEVGLWDSLNHLRMVTEIERAFGIRLAQKEIREMTSFGRIRQAVLRHAAPGSEG